MNHGAETFERAVRLANDAIFAVDLQVRRLKSAEPEDAAFVFRKWFDFAFLAVALTRLRRATVLAMQASDSSREIARALDEFDRALPHLKRLRDVAEHSDDYSLGKGRVRGIDARGLEVSSIEGAGPSLQWLDRDLDADIARRSASRLVQAILRERTTT